MGNSLRCCLACVLPFGALDVIRIVHLNGHVEELTRPISAGQVLEANPNYILTKPSSQGRILILSPNSDLKRGHIYFLIPASSVPQKKMTHNKKSSNKSIVTVQVTDGRDSHLSDKKSSCRDRRIGRVNIWRPRLESIYED
ncbi:uncharacterized protein LOC143847813 [Tasmannia lanceolata]|uniref:uncharacterized protein LOC143847813 n=1 Tax=Tasmannia lanceolata TaxID=3420 RepID=UPI0040628DF8